MLVVRWEKTTRDATQDALRLLNGSGARIMGAIMTRINLRTAAMSVGRMSYAFSTYHGLYSGRT
jgi:polysaccharide biosynthesis transport protein